MLLYSFRLGSDLPFVVTGGKVRRERLKKIFVNLILTRKNKIRRILSRAFLIKPFSEFAHF